MPELGLTKIIYCLYTWPWLTPGSRKNFMVPCNSHNLMKKTDYSSFFLIFCLCFLWERGHKLYFPFRIGLPRWFSGKEFTNNAGDPGLTPGSGSSWRREWQPTLISFPKESHGQRSLGGYSPWDWKRIEHNLATKQQKQQADAQRYLMTCPRSHS